MNNFFLLNEAIDTDDLAIFKSGLSKLIPIRTAGKEMDHFYKHDSMWNLKMWIEIFADRSQEIIAIIKFVEQLRSYSSYLSNEVVFNTEFPDKANAFLGFDFSVTAIAVERQVIDLISFLKFRNDYLWKVNFRNFWDRRALLYPNLTLCGSVEEQILL